MPIYLNENDVAEFLDMPSAVQALRDAFLARGREEANVLGQIRTGAATGVATEVMARPEGKCVALIGTGRQARTQALALRAVGMLSELSVFARTPDKCEAFC